MLFNLGTQFFEIEDKELLEELSKNKLLDHRTIKKYNYKLKEETRQTSFVSNTIKVNDTIKAFYKKSFKLIVDTLITGIEYNNINKKYMLLTNKNKMYEFDIIINTSSLTIRNRFKQVYNYDPPLLKFVYDHKINSDFIKNFDDNHEVLPKSVAYVQLMGLDQFFDQLQYECFEVKDKRLFLVKEEELNDKDAINNPIV